MIIHRANKFLTLMTWSIRKYVINHKKQSTFTITSITPIPITTINFTITYTITTTSITITSTTTTATTITTTSGTPTTTAAGTTNEGHVKNALVVKDQKKTDLAAVAFSKIYPDPLRFIQTLARAGSLMLMDKCRGRAAIGWIQIRQTPQQRKGHRYSWARWVDVMGVQKSMCINI